MPHSASADLSSLITFRRVEDSDLGVLHRWLNDPAVVAWWEGDDVSWPAVVRDYGSDHQERVEHWLALLDGDPLGWIQWYNASDFADGETSYWGDHVELATTAGIDYLIGEASARGRGLGAALIRAFASDVLFPRQPDLQLVAAGPFEANVASWKALKKAGFTRRAVLDDEEGACVLYTLTRDELADDRAT